MSTPCWRRSRSRNVFVKLFLQEKLSALFLARNDKGNPPRTQRRVVSFCPTSDRSKPSIWINSKRPARDSDDCFKRSGDALPKIKNLAGNGFRSNSTRRIEKR